MTPTNTEALVRELEQRQISNWIHSTGTPPRVNGTKPDPLCQQAAAELRRLSALCAEWEAKAATWLASPEAAQRLAGYRELGRECAELEAENESIREALAAKITTETLLTGAHGKPGEFFIGLQGGAAQLLAEGLAQQFKDSDATNYLELRFTSRFAAVDTDFVVTVQKVSGKTPAMLRAEAEAERDALKADAERYRWLRERYPTLTREMPAKALGLDLRRLYVNTREKFDAAIDAAMKGTQ